MSKKENRFQVINSREYFGKYEVIDIETNETYKFYNLASARNWAKEQNEKTQTEELCCEACGCTPCDCNWGTS